MRSWWKKCKWASLLVAYSVSVTHTVPSSPQGESGRPGRTGERGLPGPPVSHQQPRVHWSHRRLLTPKLLPDCMELTWTTEGISLPDVLLPEHPLVSSPIRFRAWRARRACLDSLGWKDTEWVESPNRLSWCYFPNQYHCLYAPNRWFSQQTSYLEKVVKLDLSAFK